VLDRDPAARGRIELRDGQKRKDRDHDGHVPATRTSRLLIVVAQGAFAIVDGMSVDRAVRMHVSDDVALCMMMNRMPLNRLPLTVAMMVMAVHACCGLRDEGPLNSKRQRGRHHHDVGAPSKRGPRTKAQLTSS